jgi:hypothetical protein
VGRRRKKKKKKSFFAKRIEEEEMTLWESSFISDPLSNTSAL